MLMEAAKKERQWSTIAKWRLEDDPREASAGDE
jgi:hypothetical protein